MSLRRPHLNLIGAYAIRHALRSGAGLVFLLLAAFFGLMVANGLISPVQMAIKEERKAGVDRDSAETVQDLVKFVQPAVEWAIAPPENDDEAVQTAAEEKTERWASYLMEERPAILSAIFLVLLFGMPFVYPFGAFNQTAGDIGSRGLRYVLLRTERGNIFLGRFLGTALFSVAVVAVTVAVIALYLALKVKIYGGMELTVWSLVGFLALTFQALPFVALCAWLSACNDSSMVSLLVCKLVIGGVLLVAFLAAKQWSSAYYLKWLLPWGVQNHLLAPDYSTAALAALACLGYTAVFLFLGYRKFETRDL